MNMNSSQKKPSGQQLSRREAIRMMTFGSLGLAMGGSVFQSCASNSSSTGKSSGTATGEAIRMSAPDGTKIITRSWPGLDEEVGLLGLGCMRLPQLPKGQGRPGELDQEKVNEMVDYAIEHGINYFDTAPAYGDSERAMGVALSRHDRSAYRLATKMSNFNRGKLPTADEAKAMFAKSLENLKTDYVDFYLLHALGDSRDFMVRFIDNGLIDWLFEQKAAGKIRHLGFSYHGSNSFLSELIAMDYKWDFVQIQMNYIDWKDMGGTADSPCDSKTLYEALEAKGIPVVVMEPIRGGALANINTKLKEMLAEKYPSLSPAGVALTFAASFPGVLCTLSGMSNMAQLKENIATFTDFKPFGEEDNQYMMKIADLYNANPHIPCTSCQYCMPCPSGVNIPGNFAIFNNASDELMMPDPNGPKDKIYKANRKELLKRYKENLVDSSRADACTQCGVCLSKCPQHIRIPDTLERIQDLIEQIK